MNFNIKSGQAGLMALNDGTKKNYGVIRIIEEQSKLIFYTGVGLREMFKPNMTEEEKTKAAALKKLDEKELMKLGYVSGILLSDIKEMS